MKNKITKILSKPKVVISFAIFIGVVVMVFGYNMVGKAPVINNMDIKEEEQLGNSGDVINLSFLKSGRIADVFVKEGQEVKKGEVLVKLSAPEQEGALLQAKSSLDLAQAQFASLNNQYSNTEKQQDLIVKNAYQVLLSSGLEGVPDKQTSNIPPVISGTYTCDKEGTYLIKPYRSGDGDSGYSFSFSGIENEVASVKFTNAIPLGNCGLQIRFNEANFESNINWTINIPNTKGSTYLANKNAYELAKETRSKVLDELLMNIGKTDTGISVAKATIEAARGAYEAVLGAYQNNLIVAPVDGVIKFVDKNLIVGQSVTAGKNVISITIK